MWRGASLPLLWVLLCAGLYLETLLLPPLGGWLNWARWFWTPLGWTPADSLRALARLALPVACVVLLDLCALAAGRSLLRWAWKRVPDTAPVVPLAAGLVGVLPLALLGLGLAGLLRAPLLLALAAAGALSLVPRRPRLAGSTPPAVPALVAAILLLPSLVAALAPEIQYDALQYHLALPRRFLEAGRFYLADPWPHSNFHLGVEMLFVPAMAAAGDACAKLVNWQLLPLALLAAWRAARTTGLGGTAAHLPWLALAISPLFSVIAGQSFTDGGPVLAVAAAVLCRLSSGSVPAALACGILLGAAGAAKLPFALYGLAFLLFLVPRRLPALAGWLAVVGAWPLKNLLLTGSPFGGITLDWLWPSFRAGENCLYVLESGHWSQPGDPATWLGLPFFILRKGVLLGFEYTPLLVVLLPGLLGRREGAILSIRNAALAGFALWPLTGGGQIRWLAPLVLPIVLACVVPLSRRAGEWFPGRAARWALVLAVAAGFLRTSATLYMLARPLNVSAGIVDSRLYLANYLGTAPSYMAVGGYLADDPRLGRPYLAGDIKSYYWPRSPLNDSQFIYPRFFRWARDSHDERGLLSRLRQERIGSVAYRVEGAYTLQSLAGGFPWTDRSLAVLQRFWVSRLSLVHSVERGDLKSLYYVYAVANPRVRPAIRDLHWLNLPGAEGILHDADKLLEAGRLREARGLYRAAARKYPSLALVPLRLAEACRMERDGAGEAAQERVAARLLGLSR